jgi:hypothetical protein
MQKNVSGTRTRASNSKNEHLPRKVNDVNKKIVYPYKTVNGRKMRLHRAIMEEHLGRQLDSDEFVYHLNGDGLDNAIENLVVIKKEIK